MLPLLGDTSKAPFGSQDHSTALLAFKFPEMGCLDLGWSLLAGKASVGSLRPHLCFFPCYPEEFLSTITNLIEVPLFNAFYVLLLLLLSRFSRATPETAAHQAPPSLGFSRQEHWSGLPFPAPMHES